MKLLQGKTGIRQTITTIILHIATIWGSLILAFVLFFIIADIFGSSGTDNSSVSTKDMITFTFFPLGTIIGLAIALKWEGLGGAIATCSMAALFIIRVDLLSDPTFLGLISPPGLLYLVYWSMNRAAATNTAAVDNLNR